MFEADVEEIIERCAGLKVSESEEFKRVVKVIEDGDESCFPPFVMVLVACNTGELVCDVPDKDLHSFEAALHPDASLQSSDVERCSASINNLVLRVQSPLFSHTPPPRSHLQACCGRSVV